MIDEQSKRLNTTIDMSREGRSQIETVESLLSTLIIAEPYMYEQTKELNANYKELSATYVSHLLSGTDGACERYKCRDALNEYEYSAEIYMACVMDIKWLIDELYALKIVELCRTGV